MANDKKAALFVLLGQSNAVGHGAPMSAHDRMEQPLSNVYGLSREHNQSLTLEELTWSGYESSGMNLGETQDHTYSLANLLAARWQAAKDSDPTLPDLYVVQIAVGAQGVTEGYMWHPSYPEGLIPGPLGTANISLSPFSRRILSLIDSAFRKMGLGYDVVGVHWRGGENDVTAPTQGLYDTLLSLYERMILEWNELLGTPPIVLHRLVMEDRCRDLDPTGEYLCRMHVINEVFDALASRHENVRVLDPRTAPEYRPSTRGSGLFLEDAVHFTPEVNAYLAEEILSQYRSRRRASDEESSVKSICL